MIRIAVTGAAGRMGKAIIRLARESKQFEIAGAIEKSDHPVIGCDIGELIGVPPVGVRVSGDLRAVLEKTEVLIDFTYASEMRDNLDAAVKAKVAYVVGTTGLDLAAKKILAEASKQIPIVQSPNMSIGVNLLFVLAELAAKALDDSYDIEIAEVHHRGKKDAPSGTALKLLEILAAARKINPEKDAVFGRKGDIGVRPKGQIGLSTLRGGDVVGEHTISFFGDGERIELTHRASSRDAFAKGALCAAKFLKDKKAGLYDMGQVLGIG